MSPLQRWEPVTGSVIFRCLPGKPNRDCGRREGRGVCGREQSQATAPQGPHCFGLIYSLYAVSSP